MDKSGYGLVFARVDNRALKTGLDYSKILTTSSQILDNIRKSSIITNKEMDSMTKEEALEILKEDLKPFNENGVTLLRYIGEYVGESTPNKEEYIFTVYYYSSVDPIDPTYAFYFFVNKETKEITPANAPASEERLKWVQENCEKINISVE